MIGEVSSAQEINRLQNDVDALVQWHLILRVNFYVFEPSFINVRRSLREIGLLLATSNGRIFLNTNHTFTKLAELFYHSN